MSSVPTLSADALQEQLRGVYDLERLLSRVATGRASPRDLSFVARTLSALPKVKNILPAGSKLAPGESPSRPIWRCSGTKFGPG